MPTVGGCRRAGEMAHTVVAEDLDLIPDIQIGQITTGFLRHAPPPTPTRKHMEALKINVILEK